MIKTLAASLLLVLACAQPSSPCDEAAAHLETCLPGLVADRPATCSGNDQIQAEYVLSRTCQQLLLDASDGKADGVPTLQGVRIRNEGNLTYFSIPLARVASDDRGALLDQMVQQFDTKMGELNGQMIAHGIDLSSVLTGDAAAEFQANLKSTLDAIVASDQSSNVAVEVGDTTSNPTELSSWERYVIPQAFSVYFSAKFSIDYGVGGGFSATVMPVVQPWLTLAVDHTLAQPTVVDKEYEVNVDVIGIPNVDIGFGAGGGVAFRVGLAAAFGPLDEPADLAGWGIGLSATATAPVIGGLQGKFVTILRYPPLLLLMLGYNTGTSGELEVHGNLQKLMDLDSFLMWIDSLVAGHSATPNTN
jgi:hypothetical protein